MVVVYCSAWIPYDLTIQDRVPVRSTYILVGAYLHCLQKPAQSKEGLML